MKITPIEIQQHQFKTRMLGYDSSAVDQFLEMVANELERLHKNNHDLKEALARTRTGLEQMENREQALQETLMTAQKVSEELKSVARKEADVVMVEARLQGEQIVRQAEERRLQLINEIQEIKRQKISFECSLRSLIEGHAKMLDLETFALEKNEDPTFMLEAQLGLETRDFER